MSDEQTEQATPHKKQKARESGDRVRSRELLQGAAMLAGLTTIGMVGGNFVNDWRQCFARSVGFAVTMRDSNWDSRSVLLVIRTALLPAFVPIAAVLGASMTAVVGVGLAQGGGLQFSAKPLQPSLNRLNPGSHVKQMFSVKALIRVVKSLLPAMLVAWFGWKALNDLVTPMPVLSLQRLPMTFAAAYGLGVKAAWVMVCWSAIDYVVEWRAWNKRLKMSKQEIREETKTMNGNPQIKGKIRQMQRAMRRRRAKVDMKRASVVITNPTHYAVALEFSFETMSAPTVLTKGRDLHALDIREEARWAGVPIIENPPLARSLYRNVEEGQSIPYELYAAVAGILAFLFKQQQEEKMREQRRAKQAKAEQKMKARMQGFGGGM